MSDFLKRTWAEVDLDKIEKNYRAIRAYVNPRSKIMTVVKADGYGHGASFAAKTFDEAGADWFAVSNIEEAEQLRLSGIQKPILILGYTPPEFAAELIAKQITQTLFSLDYAQQLSAAAVQAGGTVDVHLKLDTGMSRIGFLYHGEEDTSALLQDACGAAKLPGLRIGGVFTHFAVSDEPGNPFTALQFSRFIHAIELLEEKGVHFALRHCCNSAGLLNYPDMQLDMVRPGIILYGLTPAVGMPLPIQLYPAMSLKTTLFQTKMLAADTPVSYGMTYRTPSERRLGTLPIGYADGYPRSLSGKADVLIRGKRARIVGRVCMDQCMADITDIPEAESGDEVTVIGCDGTQAIPMEEIAAHMGTINYETACLIGKRVPRVFFKGGRQVGQLNYILP
ncbi:MAG: alanine racemase [Ethanoligenens sp.]